MFYVYATVPDAVAPFNDVIKALQSFGGAVPKSIETTLVLAVLKSSVVLAMSHMMFASVVLS